MKLTIKNIKKKLRSHIILHGIDLEVSNSNMVGIVGENGVGKSTLLKIIVGDWEADDGEINVDGIIGYCPQEPTLFSNLTVKENFFYFGTAYGLTSDQIEKQISELTSYFNFTYFVDRKVEFLSGGTRQKLNLSIALMHDPTILILDEPYAGFDIETYRLFIGKVQSLKESGCSIVMVTHFLTETEYFDHIYNLKNGILK